MIAQCGKGGGRGGIGPSRPFHCTPIYTEGEILGVPFPLADRCLLRSQQILQPDICRRDIVGRRMAGLQHAQRPTCVSNHSAVENNLNVPPGRLQAGWAWIIPYRFLPRPGFNAFDVPHGAHELYKERCHVLLLDDSFHFGVSRASLEASGSLQHFGQQMDIAHCI